MIQKDLEQLHKDYRDNYIILLDILARIINETTKKYTRDEGEWLESAFLVAYKYFGHALTILYLSHGTNQELPSLKFDKVDLASIDVITRAMIEGFLIFHYVFKSPANLEEKVYRYWAYKAAGIANRESILTYIGTEDEKQDSNTEKDNILNHLKNNKIYQNIKNKKKEERIFSGNGLWRVKNNTGDLITWNNIAIQAGFSKTLANLIYNILCGVAHSSIFGILQTCITENKRNEQDMLTATFTIVNIITANLIKEFYELFTNIEYIPSNDNNILNTLNYWVEKGHKLDEIMGI